MPDAVVVGAGPNGLSAAITLAAAGIGVTVLEATDRIGGGVRSGESIRPGLVFDHCAAIHVMPAGSRFIREQGLDRHGLRLSQVALDLDFHQEFQSARRRIAYERLYLDAIEGNGTLFVRRDEVEAQWRWVDGIRKVWGETAMEAKPYAAGSWGPNAAIALTERDGRSWND